MMKKNTLIAALVAAALLGCTLLPADGLIYLVAAFMAMAVFGIMRVCRSGMTKMARWSKANPHKAQWFIAGIELALMGLGLIAGFNLKRLGFIFSDATAFVFFALLVVGFLSVHFWPKRDTIAIPKEVDKQRLAYLGISLSFVMTMAFVGNRIGDLYPDSTLSLALEKTDRALFSSYSPETDQEDALTGTEQDAAHPLALASLKVPDGQTIDRGSAPDKTALKKAAKAEKKMKREEKKLERKARKDFRRALRLAAAGGMCALAVLLIILLLGTTCAGVCLFIFGVNEGTVASIIFGPVIVGLSVWAIIKVAKWCKRDSS